MRQLNRILTGTAVTLVLSGPVSAQEPLRIVEARRASYPTPIPREQVPVLLRGIASDLNAAGIPGGPFGILRKESGNQCGGFSCDIICSGQDSQQRQWDVLRDSPETAEPVWNEVPAGHVVPRKCIFGIIPPPPSPPPPPSGLEIRVADLERKLQELHERFVAQSVDLNAVKNAITQLQALVNQLQENIGRTNEELVKQQDQLDNRCVTGRVAGFIPVRSCPEPRR